MQALTPAGANGGFRWRGKLYHLTYKGHIPPILLRARVLNLSTIRVIGISCVHETSDAEAPYDHTHFAWIWERAVDLVGCDKMDVHFGGARVHPHIQTSKSLAWMERVFTQYHRGFKASADGKLAFSEPADGPWQELPAEFEWSEYIVSEVQESSDLQSGCAAAGIRPRSVSDVMLLQNNKRPAAFDHNFDRASFKPLSLPTEFTSREMGTLQIYGPVRLGKTEWACAQFDNPLLVTSRDVLKEFRPGFHDGIVLDKMLFRDWAVCDAEQLTEYNQDVRLKCRYGTARIPKRTPKIVVTNEKDAWPLDPHGQLVGRRVVQLEITFRLY